MRVIISEVCGHTTSQIDCQSRPLLHRGEYNKPSQQIPYLGARIAGSLVGDLPSLRDASRTAIANVGMAGTPSIEAIVKAKPDLILGLDIANTQHYQTLSKIAAMYLSLRRSPLYQQISVVASGYILVNWLNC